MRHPFKLIFFFFLSTCFVVTFGCSAQNEYHYATNPEALIKALNQCPQKSPRQITCEKLSEVAQRINQLAYQLRADQQAFGKEVLALQETIITQRQMLEKNPSEISIQKHLERNERNLKEHLAVVRWLASPDSHSS